MSKRVDVAVKLIARYGGHSIKASGAVELKLEIDYSELTSTLQMAQLLNEHMDVRMKMPEDKGPLSIGTMLLKKLEVFSDGTSRVVLDSDVDSIETTSINRMVDKDKRFVVRCTATVEIEEAKGDEW